jgi:hypothetical protein
MGLSATNVRVGEQTRQGNNRVDGASAAGLD